jgi:membrane protease subunit HflK
VFTEYQRAPQVTRERMYLETIQQVMGSTSKIIVDQKQGSNLLYLPIDKLMQQTAQSAPPVEVPVQSAPVPQTQVQDTTRRDSVRTRDREAGR